MLRKKQIDFTYDTAATQPAPQNKKRGAKAGLARTKLMKAIFNK